MTLRKLRLVMGEGLATEGVIKEIGEAITIWICLFCSNEWLGGISAEHVLLPIPEVAICDQKIG